MRAGLKFGGRFAGVGKVSPNVAQQAIEFAIEAVRFGFALYEYDQLKKITSNLEDILYDVKQQGEEKRIQNAKELEKKRILFQESMDKEQVARIRALKTMEQQLLEQRKKSIRLEKIKLEIKTQEFSQQLHIAQERITLLASSIILLQNEVEWWKKILDRQLGDAAVQTMQQVNQLDEDIRQLQVMHKDAAMNMI